MIIGVGIFIGLLFACLAIKMGFYETWILLLNLVISVYLSIFLGLMFVDRSLSSTKNSYGGVGAVFLIAVGCFLILQVASFFLFTSLFKIDFPKLFDNLGAGLLGFLAGFFVWSFASILIGISPISQITFFEKLGISNDTQRADVQYVSWWCDIVNNFVATKSNDFTTAEAIYELRMPEKKKQAKRKRETDMDTESFDSNEVNLEDFEETLMEPPPDTDIDEI